MFNLQASQHFHCFRIYREKQPRFSCAAAVGLSFSSRRWMWATAAPAW
ncbi:hypothetical protein ABLN72_10665 [Mycobacterium tuberculosis]